MLLSKWQRDGDTFDHRFNRREVQDKLAQWAGLTCEEWVADVERRKAVLYGMLSEGVVGISATRAALRAFGG